MTDVTPDAKAIFFDALERDTPEKLAQFLDEACGDNADLRARVEGLLSARENAGRFLGGKSLDPTTDAGVLERPGTEIGPYKLLQKLGEGGMGVVYLAEQSEPVKRRVALKVIKPGMDSQQVIARFEAERQALALMDHPNIAKVLDAATTDSGRPYFVMELVKGIPLTNYCDEQHLTPRERLELFVPVCQAVQHAHQKGIIHRDLKPSNVLVALYDGRPVPKVIDFGVAKATSQQLTAKTMFTAVGQIVGTLEYMSPEQAQVNQLDVDTRSDIYSLGVLLYELLTGATPFDRKRLRSAAFDEMMRIIREEEPPRPSMRLSTVDTLPSIAANRRIDPHRLRSLVRGELDWIVMKALEKDRARRYETANGFAADIQHYLDDEPVIACPPSAGYRFRKFTRRNKAVLATAGIIAVALLFGLIGTTSQWWRAESAAKRAEDQRNRAELSEQDATRERDIARQQRDENRRLLYVSDIIAAQQAWGTANLGRVTELLRRYEEPGQEDLRRFAWYYLARLCQRGLETPTLEGHGGFVWGVAFSPDGTTLATASNDATVKLWDVETLKQRRTLTGYGKTVLSVSFSPDGNILATGDVEGMVKLWDPMTGELRRSIQGAGPVTGVAISATGKLLAGSIDGTVTLSNLPTGDPRIIFGKLGGPGVWSVAISGDGEKLAFSSVDGTVRLRDARINEDWIELEGHTSWARSVALSPDGRNLASASHDHTVRLWDTATGKVKHTLKHRDRAWSVAFSPDSGTLASAGNTVKLWDVATGSETDTLIGHEQMVYAVAFSPDGKTLASGSHDTKVKLWDLTGSVVGDTLRNHTGTVWDVAVSGDGGTLASGSEDGTVRLWNVVTGQEMKTLEGHSNWVTCVAFHPHGETLASAGDDGTIKLWDVRTGEEHDIRLTHSEPAPQTVWDLAFSPDGETLASAGNDATVRLWDSQTGEETARFTEHTKIVWAVAFSSDGKKLASGSDDNTVKLWDLESGREPVTLPGHTSVVFSVAFSPDGRTLGSGSGDGTVKLWDLETGNLLETLTGHTGLVWSVAFSPSGRTLASSSHDATIKLWDLASGQEPETLIGHSSGVQSVVFAPDGKTVISGSGDRTVKLWRRISQSATRLAGR